MDCHAFIQCEEAVPTNRKHVKSVGLRPTNIACLFADKNQLRFHSLSEFSAAADRTELPVELAPHIFRGNSNRLA